MQLFVLIFSTAICLSLDAYGNIVKEKYTGRSGYTAIEILDDDLIHLEVSVIDGWKS